MSSFEEHNSSPAPGPRLSPESNPALHEPSPAHPSFNSASGTTSPNGAFNQGHLPAPPLMARSSSHEGGSSAYSGPGGMPYYSRSSNASPAPSASHYNNNHHRISPGSIPPPYLQHYPLQHQHFLPQKQLHHYGSDPHLNQNMYLNAQMGGPAKRNMRHVSPMMAHANLSHEGRPISRNQQRERPQNLNIFEHEGRTQVFVDNLPFRVRWQDLKDLFRKCGSVLRSNVDLTLDNRSKGYGTVLFANHEDAYNAIETFNGYTWQSRVLEVRLDQQDPDGAIAMANASAQAAQQAAQQSHQQAMQNMASMVGAGMFGVPNFSPYNPQLAAAAAALHAAGQNQHAMATAGSPYMNAAMMAAAGNAPHNANLAAVAAANGFPVNPQAVPHVQPGLRPSSSSTSLAGLSHHLHGLSLAQQSHHSDSRPSSRPGTSQGAISGRSSVAARTATESTSTSPSTHGQTLPASSPGAKTEEAAAAITPPPTSISPTSARRAPPGGLGPMPPSIFANLGANQHLPNPPAAAAAAKAAGYALEEEGKGALNVSSPELPSQADTVGGAKDSQVESQETAARSDVSSPNIQHRQQQQGAYQGSAFGGSPLGPPPAFNQGGASDFYQHSNGSQQSMPNGISHYPHHLQNNAMPPHMLGHQQRPNDRNFGMPGNMSAFRNTPPPSFHQNNAGGYSNRHLFIANIPFNCQWQDLKDLFRAAGSILRADVALGPDGRSKGCGTVLYATPEDAQNAIEMFNGYEYQGRILKVHYDKHNGANGYQMGQNGYGSMERQYSPAGLGQRGSPGMMHAQIPQSRYQPQDDYRQQPHQTIFGNGPSRPPMSHQPLSIQHQLAQAYNPGEGDTNSVPGTPVQEMNLQNFAAMGGYPSPGFTSAAQRQQSRPAEQRRDVAPIGSNAHHHYASGEHAQSSTAGNGNFPPPLSPLTIPPRGAAPMPMPSPLGMFSPPMGGGGPMSPQQGLPLMTPSMPGFSFHPFPQTPPLLPQFLSPGLGPFSPPLAGGANFFPVNPSGLRNLAPGAPVQDETTPLQSPHLPHYQQNNYFPMMMSPGLPVRGGYGHGPILDDASQHLGEGITMAPGATPVEGLQTFPSSGAGSSQRDDSEEQQEDGSHTPKMPSSPVITPEASQEVPTSPTSSSDVAQSITNTPRRASFKALTSTASTLGPPSSGPSAGRGVSLDIPRPNIDLGDLKPDVGSAVADDTPSPEEGEDSFVDLNEESAKEVVVEEKSVKKAPEVVQVAVKPAAMAEEKDEKESSEAAQEKPAPVKKSAWNLAWLKK